MVTGLTYNFVNPSTDYQNGIDWHLDWGASQFVTKTVQVGAVGYFYQQLTADGGQAPFLGETLSRMNWAANRFHLPGRAAARLSQFQGLWRIRRPEPGRRLECLGDVGLLAERGDAATGKKASYDYQIERAVPG